MLDDSERESEWNQALEKWKSDAQCDGAGHSLASYDGVERKVMIDGEWYYIYRVG